MMLSFDQNAFFVGGVILLLLLAALYRWKRSLSYLACFSVFWIYLLFVVKEAVFPIYIPATGSAEQQAFAPSLNLIPLYFGKCQVPSFCLRNILENMALTIPFGFGICFIVRLRARDFRWLPFAVGMALETIQLMTSLLFRSSFRVIDINDVLINAAGALIGYGLFRVFARLYLAFTQQLSLKHSGLWAYVYQVALQSQPRDLA